MTPLHVAAKKGDRLDIVEYLIGKGANINIEDYSGVSGRLYYCLNTECLSIVHIYIYEMWDTYS